MTLSSTKSSVGSVLQWLNGTDETQWQSQTSLLRQTIAEFKRMSAPLHSKSKTGSRSAQIPTYDPASQKAGEAIPHLERMMYEMLGRKRAEAVDPALAAALGRS